MHKLPNRLHMQYYIQIFVNLGGGSWAYENSPIIDKFVRIYPQAATKSIVSKGNYVGSSAPESQPKIREHRIEKIITKIETWKVTSFS